MEIYNENINDLLLPGKTNLKVKDDPNVIILKFFNLLYSTELMFTN